MSVFAKDLLGCSKYEKSIQILKMYCAASGGGYKKVLCAFSGGKDSQCCYHLLRDAGIPFSAQYSITRFEPPELIQFIRDNYSDVVFRRAYTMSLIDEIEYRGLPNRWNRWCCKAKHTATPGFDIAVIGVRAGESARRASNWRTFGYKADKTAYVCPIFEWSESEVWEYLNSKNIPHCRLYDEGYDRIGCVCCPLTCKHKQEDVERYPKIVAMLRKGTEMFVERMRSQGFVTKHGKPCASWCKATNPTEELFRRWIETSQVQQSVEEYKGVQEEDLPCLFAGTGFSETDGGSDEL